MTKKEKYLLTLETMAALSANAGKDFREQLNFPIMSTFTNILTSAYNDFVTEIITSPKLEKYQTVTDFQNLLEAIPSTSYETQKIANERITEQFKSIQEEELFDPIVFYNIYFLLNTATQEDLSNSPFLLTMLKNNENFSTWFSNSKVVNKENEPLVVFHGTGYDEFTRFNFDKFPVAYFAENKDYSEWFQKMRGTKGVIFSCYLRIQNPIDLRLFEVRKVKYDEFVGYIKLKYGYSLPLNTMLKSASENNNGLFAWQYIRGGVEWLKLIKTNGYFDGFKYYENNPDDLKNGKENVTPAWAVFNAEQIKSSRGNVTFSYESKDIRFAKGGKLQNC
jgi:hypothetical protein